MILNRSRAPSAGVRSKQSDVRPLLVARDTLEHLKCPPVRAWGLPGWTRCGPVRCCA